MQVFSEGPLRITRAVIESAWRRRGPGTRIVLRDAQCRGLALIVNATSMRWAYSYKPRGADPATGARPATRTISLGDPAGVTVDDARREAARIKAEIQAGADPAAERRQRIARAVAARGTTIAALMQPYAAALATRPKLRGGGGRLSPRAVQDDVQKLRAIIAAMGAAGLQPGEVTAGMIRDATDAEAARTASARARFGALHRFMDWCIERTYLDTNPCDRVPRHRRPRAPAARDHVLTLPELARPWQAAAALAPVHRDLARFLIAIPCRRGEAVGLRWDHLDLAGVVWSQPGALTKNREPHRLHLHPLALAILRRRHADAGAPAAGLVFPAPGVARSARARPEGQHPVDSFSDRKAELARAAGLDGWRWHDFRRSFATALGEAGVAEPVADAILNHRQAATRSGVLGVYQRASRWPEQVAAMERWSALLAAAVEAAGP